MRTPSQFHGNGYAGRFDVTGLAAFGGDQLAALHWANREKLVGKVLKFKYQKYGSQLITAADRPGIPR